MTTEFISTPIKHIRNAANNSERKVAAIAYVTKDHAEFGDSDIVICDASDRAIQSRATCRNLLRHWFESGVQVYSKADLHSKMIVFDHETAFIGSANFSEAAERRVESGIFTSAPIAVAQCEKFILDLTEASDLVDEEFLDRIDSLKLKPRVRRKPMPKATKKSTLNYWFFKGTQSHSKKALETEATMRSDWSEGVSEPTSEDYGDEVPENENPLYFRALSHYSPRWRSGVSRGDRVFWCYYDDDYGWIVLPPRTVVSTTRQGRSTMAGTEGRYRDEEDSIGLKVVIDRLGLRKNVSMELIEASDPKLTQLLNDWDDLID